LLPSHRKWRARHSSSKQIDTKKARGIESTHISLNDIPMRPIQSKGGTRVLIDLDQSNVVETGRLQAQRLTATARTNL
jgi:hypothetical protein